ncbi:MAG: DUF1571 domain-containing protein [Bacteroidota bacterium]
MRTVTFKKTMRFYCFLILFLYSFTLFPQYSREQLKDFKIITDMMDSVKKITYLRCNMKSLERIETGYSVAYTSVKLQTSPRKSYLQNQEKKLEVLYNSEISKNRCVVKPHVFPYFTLNLDPTGNLMRKNQHFTIFELGFDFTVKTIAIALSKEKDQITKHLSLAGKVEKNKMNCYLFVYENNNFTYNDYVVQEKETVSSIATKFVANDYMIRTRNKLYDDYGYLKKGSTIKIPSFYCKKVLFYVDEKSLLPVCVILYDEVGLFETYEYTDIELNKPIPAVEFTKGFKGYGF